MVVQALTKYPVEGVDGRCRTLRSTSNHFGGCHFFVIHCVITYSIVRYISWDSHDCEESEEDEKMKNCDGDEERERRPEGDEEDEARFTKMRMKMSELVILLDRVILK